jgi:serine/threonine-protein kinase
VSEAETVYRELVAARPDFWAAHLRFGWFFYAQDDIDGAESEWRFALALAPRDVQTLSNLGAVRFRREEWTEARELFLEAFRIRPACDPCNNIATTLYFDGEFEESSRYFEFAVQYCDTNDCTTWGNLASALYWTEKGKDRSVAVYRTAIRKANEALAAKPGDATLTALLIDYYSMSGDSAMTRTTIAHARDMLEENPRVMYAVGSAYEKLGERELALHHLGNALRHGYSLKVIQGAPLLDDLVRDPRFQEMIRSQSAAEGAEAAHSNR